MAGPYRPVRLLAALLLRAAGRRATPRSRKAVSSMAALPDGDALRPWLHRHRVTHATDAQACLPQTEDQARAQWGGRGRRPRD